ARSLTSGLYLLFVFMTPYSQSLESPTIPGRFNQMNLSRVPDAVASRLGTREGERMKVYVLEHVEGKSTTLLSYGTPAACSIHVSGVGISPIKSIMDNMSSLAPMTSGDSGFQQMASYVPGGLKGRVSEATRIAEGKRLGLVMLIFGGPSSAVQGGTVSYVPPEGAKIILDNAIGN
ncbi:hypothetical protein SAMN02745165_03731, partial [Malonomonas rubra DSM 5091]